MVIAPPINATSATSVGTIREAQQLGRGSNVLGPSNDGKEIASVNLGVRQDGDICRGSASCDFPQEHAARGGGVGPTRPVSCRRPTCWSRDGRRLPPAPPTVPGPRLHSPPSPTTLTERLAPPKRATTSPSLSTVSGLHPRSLHCDVPASTKTRASGSMASASIARRPTAFPPGFKRNARTPTGARPILAHRAPSCRPAFPHSPYRR